MPMVNMKLKFGKKKAEKPLSSSVSSPAPSNASGQQPVPPSPPSSFSKSLHDDLESEPALGLENITVEMTASVNSFVDAEGGLSSPPRFGRKDSKSKIMNMSYYPDGVGIGPGIMFAGLNAKLVESIYTSTGPRHDNEDRYMYTILPAFDTPAMKDEGPLVAFGVFDGHGGHNCSQFLADNLETFLLQSSAWSKDGLTLPERLRLGVMDALARAENEFMEWATANGDMSGACVIFGVMCNGHVCTGNIGDSLGVLCVPGKDGEKQSWIDLARPHRSFEETEMERIVKAGGIVVNRRAFGVLEPSRSIGDKDVKLYCLGAVVADPHMTQLVLPKNAAPLPAEDKPKSKSRFGGSVKVDSAAQTAFLIVASDGLWDVVAKQTVVEETKKVLKKNRGKKPSAAVNAARHLVRTAIKYGTMDDTTAIVLEILPL